MLSLQLKILNYEINGPNEGPDIAETLQIAHVPPRLVAFKTKYLMDQKVSEHSEPYEPALPLFF